jgi:hypothetical protein
VEKLRKIRTNSRHGHRAQGGHLGVAEEAAEEEEEVWWAVDRSRLESESRDSRLETR